MRAMLAALKQSPENKSLVQEATRYLSGVKGTLAQAKRIKKQREVDAANVAAADRAHMMRMSLGGGGGMAGGGGGGLGGVQLPPHRHVPTRSPIRWGKPSTSHTNDTNGIPIVVGQRKFSDRGGEGGGMNVPLPPQAPPPGPPGPNQQQQ